MKKGFTLVELLAIIVILSIILVIAVPNILNVIEKARIDAYIKNEDIVINAARNYLISNNIILPNEVGHTIEITLHEMKTLGLIDTIKNPRGNNNCNGYVLVTNIGDNSYDYIPHLNCADDTKGSSSTDDLKAHWALDGNAYDYSLNNYVATNIGAVAATERFGNVRGAMEFNGTSNYMTLPTGVINLTQDYTITLWANIHNFNVSGSGRRRLISLQGSDGSMIDLACHEENGLTFRKSESTAINKMTTNENLMSINKWYYIVLVKSGSNYILYIDGNVINVINGGITQNSSGSYLGLYTSSGGFFDGIMDDVKIYQRALLESEIKFKYDAGIVNIIQ